MSGGVAGSAGERHMNRLVLTVLMAALLLGTGPMSRGQDPTKGPESRNRENDRKLREALEGRRDAHVHFIIPEGVRYQHPGLAKAMRDLGGAWVEGHGHSGGGSITSYGDCSVLGKGEGTSRTVYNFNYRQKKAKPFTITIDYTFTKRRAPDGKK
jgi:hypothetical protein